MYNFHIFIDCKIPNFICNITQLKKNENYFKICQISQRTYFFGISSYVFLYVKKILYTETGFGGACSNSKRCTIL